MKMQRNIILIGMPGVGKSTVGVLLAKRLGLSFMDTDIYIQAREQKQLQEIIDAGGMEAFLQTEARHVLTLSVKNHVIATGGSVVYSTAGMAHLKASGTAVFLELDPVSLQQRLDNLATRGVVMAPGQSIRDLYRKRLPLYRKYADVEVACRGLTPDQVMEKIAARL